MPHGLEYIVRPYQSPNRNAFLVPSAPGGSNQRATITWGAEATIPAPEPTATNFEMACCKEELTEKVRESETVRIPIQEDANYIEVQRPITVDLNKKEDNNCDADWAQFSGVGAEIDAAFASLDADIKAGGAGVSQNCGTKWKFKN